MSFAYFDYGNFGYGADGGGSGARNYFNTRDGAGSHERFITSDGSLFVARRG